MKLSVSFDNPCICCDENKVVPHLKFGEKRTNRCRRFYNERNDICIQVIDCGELCEYTKYKPNICSWPLVEVLYKK